LGSATELEGRIRVSGSARDHRRARRLQVATASAGARGAGPGLAQRTASDERSDHSHVSDQPDRVHVQLLRRLGRGLSFDNSSGGGLQALQTFVAKVAGDVLQDSTIQGLIGTDWKIVWGPVAYSSDTSGPTVRADNTMGCYYSASQNLFVVAVAGTDSGSAFDWLDEDFDVLTQVTWTTAGGTGSGNISAGANEGLQILLAMTDASGSKMLTALAQWITNNKVSSATIAVTGHSLGGALAPVLALYMSDNQSTLTLGGQSLAVYASAGPTPGDSGFASTYATAINNGDLTYSSVYNTLDVVPLAWAVSDLATIPTLYGTNIPPAKSDSPADAFMGSLISGVVMAMSNQSVSYTQVSGRSSLAGTFNTTIDKIVSSVMNNLQSSLPSALSTYFESISNVARFAAQAAIQHTSAYPPLLSITDFYTEYQSILSADKPSLAVRRDPTQTAIRRLTGIEIAPEQRAAS
jgi:Lipase (class 3)